MSFHFSTPDGEAHSSGTVALDLPCSVNMVVPASGVAIIPHDVSIRKVELNHMVWLLKIHTGLDMDKADRLIVDTVVYESPVEQINTRVFNLTNTPIRIKRGTVLSRLVSVRCE